MAFKENLCELMQKNSVSSYKLAKGIGVHISTISNWKNGGQPLLEHVRKVSAFFGKTVDEILGSQSNK